MSPLFFSCRRYGENNVGVRYKNRRGYGENNGTKYRLLNKIDY